MASVGDAHSLVGRQREGEYAAVVRWCAGAGREAEDEGYGGCVFLPARNSSQSPPFVCRYDLLRQFCFGRYAGGGCEAQRDEITRYPLEIGAHRSLRSRLGVGC